MALLLFLLEKNLCKAINLLLIVQHCSIQKALHIIYHIGIGGIGDRGGDVVLLKRLPDFLLCVDKIQDKGVGLPLAHTIDTG